jgi:quinoprotein glucose dehydrogenase
MARGLVRSVVSISLALAAGVLFVKSPWSSVPLVGQTTGQPSTATGDWPHYNADVRGTRYSPLDQINGTNFNNLEVAWRFKTDSLGPFPEYKLEGTPLVIKGTMYSTAGTRRSVVSLDAKTGELNWVYSLREGRRAAVAPRQLSGRGVEFWTDGRGDDRILFVTTGYRLVALNAKDGKPISSFGTDGIVDLKQGVVYGNRQPIDLESRAIRWSSARRSVKASRSRRTTTPRGSSARST